DRRARASGGGALAGSGVAGNWESRGGRHAGGQVPTRRGGWGMKLLPFFIFTSRGTTVGFYPVDANGSKRPVKASRDEGPRPTDSTIVRLRRFTPKKT